MPQFTGVVSKVKQNQVYVSLEDGTVVILPLDKLPGGTCEGTFLKLSIKIDRIAALLHGSAQSQFLPKVAKT